jgi:hypothetical protein
MVLNNSRFVDPLVSCDVVLGAGSLMLVAPLIGCTDEPVVHTVQNTAAIALNATSASLRVTVPATVGTVQLYKGKVLYFGTSRLVIAEDVLLTTTAAIVQVEQVATAIASGLTADTFPLVPLLSVTEMPIAYNDTLQDSSDFRSGIQGAMTKTNYEISTQVGGRVRCDDNALNKVIFPGQKSNTKIYVAYSIGDPSGCGTLAWGTALVSNYSETNTVKDFVKFSFNLLWQPETAVIKRRADMTTVQQAEFDTAIRFLGIPTRA